MGVVGGFNLLDLPRLPRTLRRPCVAVMRKLPDLPAMERAARRLPRPRARSALLRRAGPIHLCGPFVYQVHGAHLIGGALAHGQSGRRA